MPIKSLLRKISFLTKIRVCSPKKHFWFAADIYCTLHQKTNSNIFHLSYYTENIIFHWPYHNNLHQLMKHFERFCLRRAFYLYRFRNIKSHKSMLKHVEIVNREMAMPRAQYIVEVFALFFFSTFSLWLREIPSLSFLKVFLSNFLFSKIVILNF